MEDAVSSGWEAHTKWHINPNVQPCFFINRGCADCDAMRDGFNDDQHAHNNGCGSTLATGAAAQHHGVRSFKMNCWHHTISAVFCQLYTRERKCYYVINSNSPWWFFIGGHFTNVQLYASLHYMLTCADAPINRGATYLCWFVGGCQGKLGIAPAFRLSRWWRAWNSRQESFKRQHNRRQGQ